jgi:hypothetical protein
MRKLMTGKTALLLIPYLVIAPSVAIAEKPVPASAPKPVWSADFQTKDGKFDAIKAEIDGSADHPARDQLRLLKPCGAKDNACVEVELRKPVYDEKGEVAVKYNVNGELDLGGYRGTTATLRYRFFIPDGSDFRKQGKLPGLASLNGAFGGDAPFAAIPDKWSARLMWLDTGAVKGQPKPSLYLYDQRRGKGRSGEQNKANTVITTGRWHDVAIYVHLNDVGQSNGQAELWLDQQLMICRTAMMFRNTESDAALIQRLAFHNYYGGQAKNPAEFPDQPNVMRFDDFAVYDGRATPATPDAKNCKADYSAVYITPK